MPDITPTTSCPVKYPALIEELLIHDDLIDYLKQIPDGAVKDALYKGRTRSAAKLLGIRGRAARKLWKFDELKAALDAKIKADPKLQAAYNSYAGKLDYSPNIKDLSAALIRLLSDKEFPVGSPQYKLIRERLIFEDFEQYAKNQTPGAEKRIDTLQRSRRSMRRQLNRRTLRRYKPIYKILSGNLTAKQSYRDLQGLLCRMNPCRSICPGISSITPSKVNQGQETTLVIKGKNLPTYPDVSFNPNQGIKVLDIDILTKYIKIKIKVDPKAQTGKRSISLSSSDGLFSTAATFTVLKFKAPELPNCKDAYTPGMQPAMKAAGKCK